MSTRDEILAILRRETLTIRELAGRLGLARNAVVLALQQLSADGLVVSSARKEKRAGKPALQYAAAPGREDVASSAYPPFAEQLVAALPDHLGPRDVAALMTTIGRRMADQLDVDDSLPFAARLQAVVAEVNALGAAAVVTRSDDDRATVVRSFSCPLARVVRRQPCACDAVAAFFAKVTGAHVEQRCRRDAALVCEFVIEG